MLYNNIKDLKTSIWLLKKKRNYYIFSQEYLLGKNQSYIFRY